MLPVLPVPRNFGRQQTMIQLGSLRRVLPQAKFNLDSTPLSHKHTVWMLATIIDYIRTPLTLQYRYLCQSVVHLLSATSGTARGSCWLEPSPG